MPELQKKTGLTKEKLSALLDDLLEASEIKLITFEEFKNQKNLAEQISPDPDDIAYIALALHLNCPVWSNDAALKKQNKIKIITTKELIEQFDYR